MLKKNVEHIILCDTTQMIIIVELSMVILVCKHPSDFMMIFWINDGMKTVLKQPSKRNNMA